MGSVVFLVALASVQVAVDEADVKYGVWILVLCLMGRFCNEASWGVMAGFTGESFPTVIRSLCFSICTVASSLGAVIAPQMAYLGSSK
jgi:Mn2+/Fe2+ NRAMP family transporter